MGELNIESDELLNKKSKLKDSDFPEHVPLIPIDFQRENEKEELRKLAKKMRESNNVEPIIYTSDGQVKRVSDLSLAEQEDEIVRCALDPIYFIETYLTIFDQTQGAAGMIVPFKLFDFQKELILTYNDPENRFVIANKYRQAGISTTTCAYIAWYVMFNNNRQVAIVADKLETATGELMSDVVEFIEGCPAWLRPKTGRESEKNLKDTQKLKIYDNDSRLGAFASKTLRGMTPTLLFWDETAWAEKGDVFWTAALPSLVTGGRAIMVSTPSGLDAVFYKTFDGARKGTNNFIAVELWWYNDPRYNKDLYWVKNKGKENEIRIEDNGRTNKQRAQLVDDGWEATNEWFDEQVRNANGDMRKVAQELLCVSGDSIITVRNKKTGIIENLMIEDFYRKNELIIHNQLYINNNTYEILDGSGEFVDFMGVAKSFKNEAYKISLENGDDIIVSSDHVFIAGNINAHVNTLVPYVSYLSTINGDYFVTSIDKVVGGELYDIVDSENYDYIANKIINHNCSFLGSGDNFIAEEYLKRIEESEIKPPLRQEYDNGNMWIWEEPVLGENYIMVLDASPGHGDDNSTLNMLKTIEIIEDKIITKNGKTKKVKVKRHKVEQVAEFYGKITPQMLGEMAYQYGKRYNDAYAVVDVTGGHGVHTVEKLLEIGYENVHYAEVAHKPTRDRLQGYIKKAQKTMPDGAVSMVDLIPGFFIGNNRPSVLLEMQRAIHLEDVIIRSTRLLSELKTFVTVPGNRVADHKRTFHDDSIMGLSIGLFVLNFDMARFKMNRGITEKMMNAFLTNNDINEMSKNKNNNNRPMISPDSASPLNPYGANSWLFGGLGKKTLR